MSDTITLIFYKGTLRELTPLEYPFFDHRAMPLRLEQKL